MASKKTPDRGLLRGLLDGLQARGPRIRIAASKALRLVSEQSPAQLYPYWDRFAKQLDHENSFLRWDAIRILARLAAVDREGRMEALLPRYLRPVAGPQMIAAATVIQGAALVALAQPALAERIVKGILRVEKAGYATAECRNVAIGHAILALERFWAGISGRRAVIRFVERQLDNPRPATRRKAERFLRRHADAA
jgi:hypothetical protein